MWAALTIEDSFGRDWTLRLGPIERNPAPSPAAPLAAAQIVARLLRDPTRRHFADFARFFAFCAEASQDPVWDLGAVYALETADDEERLEERLVHSLQRAIRAGRVTLERTPPPAVPPWQPPSRVDPRPTPAPTPETDDLTLAVELFDAFARPMPGRCELEVPLGAKAISLAFGARGGASHQTTERGPCGVRVFRTKRPLEREAPLGPPVPLHGARALRSDELGATFPAAPRHTPHSFQLARREVTALEIEHFFPDGALVLPGASPAKLRDGAPVILGTSALRAAYDLARRGRACAVGHHASLSLERARGVAHLLTGAREAWVSLAMRVAKPHEKRAIRAWASRALPPAGDTWDEATWGAVYDLYQSAILPTPPRPPTPLRHKLVVRSASEERENIYPYKMAEITFGKGQGARSRELEEANPHLCRGPGQWRDIVSGDEIVMPETWPPDPLLVRGFRVLPIMTDPPTQEGTTTVDAVDTVGCGARHLVYPMAGSPMRRAVERHVELLCTGEANLLACSHDGPCDTETCAAYDPLATALSYRTLAPAPTGRLRWCTSHAPKTVPAEEISLVVFSLSGEVRLVVPYTSGTALPGRGRSFDLVVPLFDREGYIQLRRGNLPLEHPVRVSFPSTGTDELILPVKEIPR